MFDRPLQILPSVRWVLASIIFVNKYLSRVWGGRVGSGGRGHIGIIKAMGPC